jgi:predicted MFS family arabinose efflux permease
LQNLRFSRPLRFLVTGSFINKAGNFIMPFFTLYLTAVYHLSISSVTLIISLMGPGSVGAGICGGMLSDQFGRRTILLFSLVATATLMLALGFAQTLLLIIPLAIGYSNGGGMASLLACKLAGRIAAVVQIIGVPDEKYGEEICAWVKLRSGEQATVEEIREFCKG